VGTIRAILRKHRLWAELQPDVRMLPARDDIGKALSEKDERALLDACAESRSRSLLPAVVLALNTGMRYSELRLLRCEQVDLAKRTVRVGKSKTEAGTGRTIPLNDRATKVLRLWAEQFQNREPDHFTFPSERYGAGGDTFEPMVYNIDPTKPITSWKESWETVKKNTGVQIRFHDLDIRASLECLKAAHRSRSSHRFSAGVRQQPSGWRSATGTSARLRSDKLSRYWTWHQSGRHERDGDDKRRARQSTNSAGGLSELGRPFQF